jgi:hypothetical protein
MVTLSGMALLVLKRTREKNDAPTLKSTPLPVHVARVVQGRVNRTHHYLGTVIGGEEAMRWLDQAIAGDPSWYARHYAYEARGDSRHIYKIVERM